MRFSLAAAAALIPVLSVSAEDFLIQVGAGGKLEFSPSNITAKAGDNIAFQFQGKNHSVTQSTLANPCTIQTAPAQGIDSGFQFVAPNATELPEWTFTLDNDTSPIWFFCAQVTPTGSHCQSGMVFSINAAPDGPKSFAAYKATAMNGAAAGGAAGGAGGAAAGGASSAADGASSVADAASSAISGALPGVTDAAGGAASAVNSAAQSAATDAANALSNAVNGATGLLGGSSNASPTNSSSGAGPSSTGAGVRVSGSTMSLVAAIGLAAGLLL